MAAITPDQMAAMLKKITDDNDAKIKQIMDAHAAQIDAAKIESDSNAVAVNNSMKLQADAQDAINIALKAQIAIKPREASFSRLPNICTLSDEATHDEMTAFYINFKEECIAMGWPDTE